MLLLRSKKERLARFQRQLLCKQSQSSLAFQPWFHQHHRQSQSLIQHQFLKKKHQLPLLKSQLQWNCKLLLRKPRKKLLLLLPLKRPRN